MKTIPLSRGYFALIDDEDFERVSQFTKWYSVRLRNGVYAATSKWGGGKRQFIYMHRLILGFPAGDVDHLNHDGLDNRRGNLRACSRSENNYNQRLRSNNTSGVKGVDWDKARNKWRAQIRVGGKGRLLGRFTDKLAATNAYRDAARELHGEFANPKGED